MTARRGAGSEFDHAVWLWRHKALGAKLPAEYERKKWSTNGQPDLTPELESGITANGSFNRPHIGATGFLVESGDFSWLRSHMAAQLRYGMGGWELPYTPYQDITAAANAIALYLSRGDDRALAIRYWRALIASWTLGTFPHRDSLIVFAAGVRKQQQPAANTAAHVLQWLMGFPIKGYGSHAQISLSDNGGGPDAVAAQNWRSYDGGVVVEALKASGAKLFSAGEVGAVRAFIFGADVSGFLPLLADVRLYWPQSYARTADRFVSWGDELGGDNPVPLTSRDGDRLQCSYAPDAVREPPGTKRGAFGSATARHLSAGRFRLEWRCADHPAKPRDLLVTEGEALMDPASGVLITVDRQGARVGGAPVSQPPPKRDPAPPPPPPPPPPPADPAAEFLGRLQRRHRPLGREIISALRGGDRTAAEALTAKLPRYARVAIRNLFAAAREGRL